MSDITKLKEAIAYNKKLITTLTTDIEELNKQFNDTTLMIVEKRISVINTLKKQNKSYNGIIDELKEKK